MLQEAPDDGAHLDAFRDAANAGPQATNAADDEIDIDAGARSTIQRLNDGGFGKRVEFGDDASRPACARMRGLAIDLGDDGVMQTERRVQQLAQPRNLRETGKLQENLMNIL